MYRARQQKKKGRKKGKEMEGKERKERTLSGRDKVQISLFYAGSKEILCIYLHHCRERSREI